MKKNLIIITTILSVLPALLVLISLTASAQTSNNYNLSAYKLPEIRYQELETKFAFSGNNNIGRIVKSKDISGNYFGNAVADYYSYMNSAKTQRTQYFTAGINGTSSYDDNYMRTLKNSTYLTSLSYGIYNKRYFPVKTFIATGLQARYSYNRYNDSREYVDTIIGFNSDISDYSHNMSARIPLEFGVGRIEQVQDYQEAIYIYEDLLKNGRAVAGKSEQEVMELATMISQLKNKRYFDSRIKNIQDIEVLDSFLIVNNFKTLSDARYFATLVDNWNFVNHFVRESGTTISLTLIPELSYNKSHFIDQLIDEKNDRETTSYGFQGGVKFEHYKPINFYWQSNTNISATGGLTQTKSSYSDTLHFSDNTQQIPQLYLLVNQSVSYYPNTRTMLTAALSGGYIEYFKDLKNEENSDSWTQQFYSDFSLSLHYYISQRLRLNVNSSLRYGDIKSEHSKTKAFHAGYSLNLAYSIF